MVITFRKDELDARMKLIDSQYETPEARARKVLAILTCQDACEITDWDVLCFCAEFMAMMSGGLPFLLPAAKHAIQDIYSLHYYNTEDIVKPSPSITRKSLGVPEVIEHTPDGKIL